MRVKGKARRMLRDGGYILETNPYPVAVCVDGIGHINDLYRKIHNIALQGTRPGELMDLVNLMDLFMNDLMELEEDECDEVDPEDEDE
jgi:hypothetical protein